MADYITIADPNWLDEIINYTTDKGLWGALIGVGVFGLIVLKVHRENVLDALKRYMVNEVKEDPAYKKSKVTLGQDKKPRIVPLDGEPFPKKEVNKAELEIIVDNYSGHTAYKNEKIFTVFTQMEGFKYDFLIGSEITDNKQDRKMLKRLLGTAKKCGPQYKLIVRGDAVKDSTTLVNVCYVSGFYNGELYEVRARPGG
jgi:hypothetical protein